MKNDESAADLIASLKVRQTKDRQRRNFLKGAATVAVCSTGLLSYGLKPAAAEAPLETTKIRLLHNPFICVAPEYLAEDLLRLEGFDKIEYVEFPGEADPHQVVAAGRADLTLDGSLSVVIGLNAGEHFVALAGIHGGCYELFGNDRVKSIRDLKGKKVAIDKLGATDHAYIASMMAYVGMDPRTDVQWVETATGMFNGPMQGFLDGKVDAFLGFPPQPQHVRAKKVGHVLVNTAQDRPWSQYFCCMAIGQREFVRTNPVATKRALRAILKATDICALEPERAARYVVKKGYESSYDIALEVIKGVSYGAWRTFDPDTALRFYALRLHEVGMIKSTPQKIIAQGTDWRFLNELKKELKA